jgi:hypothetical protein
LRAMCRAIHQQKIESGTNESRTLSRTRKAPLARRAFTAKWRTALHREVAHGPSPRSGARLAATEAKQHNVEDTRIESRSRGSAICCVRVAQLLADGITEQRTRASNTHGAVTVWSRCPPFRGRGPRRTRFSAHSALHGMQHTDTALWRRPPSRRSIRRIHQLDSRLGASQRTSQRIARRPPTSRSRRVFESKLAPTPVLTAARLEASFVDERAAAPQ